MSLHRIICIGSALTMSILFVGCAEKPVFSQPDVVIQRPSPVIATSGALLSSSSSSSLPASILIKVPFAPQAPFAVWDPLHEEACEEMSLIMVHHYLAETSLSLETAEKEVQEMISWERENGYADDVNVMELSEIASSLYGYNARVITDVTAEKIKAELAAGNPIIIPAAGRMLKNPFFSGEGPYYHMLVIIGYTNGGFITNDPGTKRGEQYWYSESVLMNAIHDWTGVKEEITTGAKNALIIER
jgi:hypothetical protein